MTELKTLKDLNYILGIEAEDENLNGDFVSRKELKQEAIKWVKYLKGDMGREYRYFDAHSNSNEILRNWIIDFFNLTEEDLK